MLINLKSILFGSRSFTNLKTLYPLRNLLPTPLNFLFLFAPAYVLQWSVGGGSCDKEGPRRNQQLASQRRRSALEKIINKYEKCMLEDSLFFLAQQTTHTHTHTQIRRSMCACLCVVTANEIIEKIKKKNERFEVSSPFFGQMQPESIDFLRNPHLFHSLSV